MKTIYPVTPWRPWFAWRPVWAGALRWGRTVERRLVHVIGPNGVGHFSYQYRTPTSP